MTGAHVLVVRRDLDELGGVNRFIEDVVRRAGWPASLIQPLQLCLGESVSNVIRHGVVGGGGAEIRVSLSERGGRVIACVEDEGAAFDPTAVAPPPPLRSLADARVGGLGIHLMRQYSARMVYARVGPCNRLVLEFDKDAPPPNPA